MSTSPRTDAQEYYFDGYYHVSADLARTIETELTARCAELADWKNHYELQRKELAEVTAAFQKECDHDFETEDHSFSHEFGTEKIFVCRCTKCGKDAEPGDMPEDERDGCDDGPRDAREEARLDP